MRAYHSWYDLHVRYLREREASLLLDDRSARCHWKHPSPWSSREPETHIVIVAGFNVNCSTGLLWLLARIIQTSPSYHITPCLDQSLRCLEVWDDTGNTSASCTGSQRNYQSAVPFGCLIGSSFTCYIVLATTFFVNCIFCQKIRLIIWIVWRQVPIAGIFFIAICSITFAYISHSLNPY